MRIAVCPGSFDPITLGHVDVVRRALTIFDEVIIGVAQNASKHYMFSPQERVDLARASVADLPGAKAAPIHGLLADYVKDVGASAIVKGLRGSADYESEQSMALLNRHLSGVETVFIMGDSGLGHIASSLVKDVASYGGKIDDLVPAPVADALTRKERHV